MAGLPYSFDVTILSDNGMTGEQLSGSDTGYFQVNSIGNDSECVISPIAMTIQDADNGIFACTITAENTALLTQELGGQEDGYPTLNTYLGIMEFSLASGPRGDTVPVFVREVASCPVT